MAVRYQTSAQREPDNLIAHERMVDVAVKSGNYPGAVDWLRKLIELNPDEGSYRMRLIDTYKAMYDKDERVEDRYREIREEFEERVRDNSKDPMTHFDLGYAYLALTSSFTLLEEDIGSASFEFKQLLSMDKDNPWGYWGLKRVYNKESIAGKHMYDEAIQVCKQAMEKNPMSARACFELGEAYNENYDRNLKSDALTEYQKAVYLDSTMVEAHFKIATIHRILNNYDEAIKSYNRVITLDPASNYAKDARRSLVHIEKSRTEML